MAEFEQLEIGGVFLVKAARHDDRRGWLVETFRRDALAQAGLPGLEPAMAYASLTRPGMARGPHEHLEQTDHFGFVGPSDFRVFLWDNRRQSPTFGRRLVLTLGESRPGMLVVPPRVVHAYRNIGGRDGLVLNYPNRLYMGEGRKQPVDEIRYEDDPASPFRLEERE